MKHIIESIIIMMHMFVIIAEWPKILRGLRKTSSTTTKATNSFLNWLGPKAIFIDMFLLFISCMGLWLAGKSADNGWPSMVWAVVFLFLVMFVSIVMVPEDHERWINS